jgi:hypothetical protein
MSMTQGLQVRRHAREAIELEMEFEIAEPHREQIRFSPNSGALERFITTGLAIDISPGGLGLITRHFVPRMCQGIVRIYRSQKAREVIFEHEVKVRRVSMHRDGYALGVAFIDPEQGIAERVEELRERFTGPSAGDLDV